MTVIPFPGTRAFAEPGWSRAELEHLVRLYSSHAGRVSAWDVALTELSDPQFFLLGPSPERDCVLSISRVAGVYVLEDETGRLLAEDRCLASIASRAGHALRPRVPAFVARILLTLCAVRGALGDRMEALLPDLEALVPLAAML